VILALAVLVVVLGTIGFQNLPGETYSFGDAFYRAIQLFALGAGSVGGSEQFSDDAGPALQIARILGPLLVGYAAFRGLIALSRQQFQLLGFRLLLRNHVVVAGLGDVGFRVATSLYDEGHRVAAIERDQGHASIQGCRERGIGVITGNATDPSLLRRLRVTSARYLIVACGDDGLNVSVAMTARRLVSDRRQGVLTTTVKLDDRHLWRMMKVWALSELEHRGFRLELLNVYSVAGRLLLDEHPPFERTETGGAESHVVVIGLDRVGLSLVLQTARLWQEEEQERQGRLRITIAGPRANAERALLLDGYPKLEVMCDRLDAAEFEIDSGELRRGNLLGDATAIYISLPGERDSIALALTLGARPDLKEVPIVVAVPDEGAGAATALSGVDTPNVRAFGLLSKALTSDLLLRGTTEVLARAAHEVYLSGIGDRDLLLEKVDPAPSWEQLPESVKDSNRRFADGIGPKLDAVNCIATPAPLVDPGESPFEFTDEEVELLAAMEHSRWREDLRRDGWQATNGTKNWERKLHPLLGVPWENLGETERNKDRLQVRALPRILGQAGFEIQRVGRRPAGDEQPVRAT
jgi:voltage-gated potassium channel Kch